MDTLKFKLDAFEGPLDLLLKLISDNQVDIYDIPISLIFEQYMAYLDEMQAMNMEIAGEFIAMASELMLIKSKMLLPSNEDTDEGDPREALALALIEYKKAKEAAGLLAEQYDAYSGRYAKETDEIEADEELSDQSIELLRQAFVRMMNKRRLLEQAVNKEQDVTLQKIIHQKVASIHEHAERIGRMFAGKKRVSFEEILFTVDNRSALIASFVAVLEMIKAQKIVMTADSDESAVYFEIKEQKAEESAWKS
ncbi:MAG: segregation/condensation protein A [Clostridiales bacterium]|nr:segregation/condensation protein A [Clostridiales bacterium]